MDSETFLAISKSQRTDTLFLSKTNLKGKIFWKRAYVPPYHHGLLSRILEHPDGGFVIAGMNRWELTANIHDPADRAQFAWIKKVDSTGILEWSHQIREVDKWGGCTIEKDGSIVLALLKSSIHPTIKKPQRWIRLMSYADDGSLNWDMSNSLIPGCDLEISDFLSNPAGGWLLTGTTTDIRKRKKKGLLIAKYNPRAELIGNPIYDSYQIKQESQASEYGWAYVDIIFQPGDIEKTFSISQWKDVDSTRQTIVIEGQVYLYDENLEVFTDQAEETQFVKPGFSSIAETIVRRHVEKHYLKP
ncbi:MAG: hypothetical protein KDE26_07790 [Bacteroidetes bacterium]|nr:hypothetical protein [Bacteroidota bacterium]